MRGKIHYAWFVCIGCALLLFCGSGLSINAFTVYQPFIMEQNGFTNAQTSGILTVRSLFSFAAMLLTQIYYRKLSLRTGMTVAGFTLVAAFGLFGFSSSLIGYYAAAAVMGLGYGLCTMIPISVMLEHWFMEKRTLAISICSASTGVSTLGIPSLLTHLVQTIGLRKTFLLEAAVVACIVLASGVLIRSDPADLQMTAYGERKENVKKKTTAGFAAVQKRDWILLIFAMLMNGAVTSVAYSHLSVLMNGQQFRPQMVALAITVSGIALTVGKLVYGWLSEKLRVEVRNILFGTILIAGLGLLCLAENHTVVLMAGSGLYGIGLSVTTVGLAEWAGDFCPEGQYDTFIRRFNVLYAAGGFLFSSLPGVLADQFGGSYVPAYGLFVVLAVIMLGIVEGIYFKRR